MKIKKDRDNGFLQLSKKLLNDKTFTLAEKGLIAIILSNKPDGEDDFKLYIEEIYTRSLDGGDSQRSVFNSLKGKGLISQNRTFCKKTGQFVWNYTRTGIEKYIGGKVPSRQIPGMEFPALENAQADKPYLETNPINNTNSNNINMNNINLNKTKEKKQASKLSEPKLIELNSDIKVKAQETIDEEQEACWPVFLKVEGEEEFDPQDHLPSDDLSNLEAPAFDDFPYEAHMADEQEERFKSFIEKDSEMEHLHIQVERESDTDRSISKEESIQRKQEQDSTTEVSISTLNGKADLNLEEKKVVFALLIKLFKQRSGEFSSEDVMNESIKAYAHKLHNADFMPSGKVVNNWNSYLSAAIQGVLNDLNVVEREKEEERLNKQIRNMKAQGYEYVDGKFVEATKVPGLKYGGN